MSDEDDDYTPRTRSRKKSALARLTAKKHGKLTDEDSVRGSQASLNNGVTR
jgi:hypothetical protein